SLFLLFYCYICGWSFSVVRATIMAIVLLGSSLCYREYDSLNSISLAGLIILAISPSALFDVSFLLSFMCVLGISMFNKSFNKFLVKIHCNNRVCNALAISIITNVSIFMVSACYFKEINIIGIFANVFILPLFSLAFVLCFIISVLFFIPFIFYLLRPLQYLIEFIRLLVYFFSRFDVFLFQTLNIPNFAVYLYAVMLFFVSRYCLASKEKKLAISSIFVAIIIGLSLSGGLV
ncbi:MAG: ComEC/Rec2 family competence protein, partial [Clostridia bacterium]|nr:ComEC/Rec2 family competence protein [Clostridia bacterium]